MERLTRLDWNKVCYDPWKLCGMGKYCPKGVHEDGGCMFGCHVLEMYRKLAEYEDMEEQGLLIHPPCKLKERLFAIWNEYGHKHIIEVEVKEISIGIYMARRMILIKTEPISKRGRIYKFYDNDFAKVIFHSREKAEQKLKEMEAKE